LLDGGVAERNVKGPKATTAGAKAKTKKAAATNTKKVAPSKTKKDTPAKTKKLVVTKTKKTAALLLPFPGVPSRAKEPLAHKSFRIYSDLNMGKWRIKLVGMRKDVGASWKKDPRNAWDKINDVLKGTIKIPKD
jgi:hypothetical protein